MGRFLLFVLWVYFPLNLFSQDIQLFQQFEGRYDQYTFGNTLNTEENGLLADCIIQTESSAELTLDTTQNVIAAYLYWAGSGDGDFAVKLNATDIVSERTFSYFLNDSLNYFSAYANVTTQIQTEGSGIYTLSELDLTAVIEDYCPNATNFGGWAISIIYEDDSLPVNQINVFDGLQGVSQNSNTLSIQITDLETIDNSGAKIGFLAWEGDRGIAVNETLRLNGTILSNPPLNPANNAFNGTNTYTNSDTLYNMDIDFYSVEGLILPGDTSAAIDLTSGQDLIMVNNIITTLNIALPDATVSIDNLQGLTECGETEVELNYTVYNTKGTDRLPPVNIGFYADNTLLATAQTTTFLQVGESESGTINLSIPASTPVDFLLRAIVDPQDLINELDDNNNEDSTPIHLLIFPEITGLHNLELCDVVGDEIFDLTNATSQINSLYTITYHHTEEDALAELNPIVSPESYQNSVNPQEIWIRVSNPDCFVIDSFQIEVINCPLPDATITIDNEIYACRQRDLLIEYSVYNLKGTNILPSGTQIAFYANATLIGQSATQNDIAIGGSEPGILEVNLPESIPNQFTLLAVVDDNGVGIGSVEELNEFNNEFQILVTFGTIPAISKLPDLTECDLGFETAVFNLLDEDLLEAITANSQGTVQFFTSLEEATLNSNPIQNPGEFQNTSNPQTIYVRLENEICFTTSSFQLIVEKCPPMIPDGISPNGDGLNDVFKIFYIVDVFPNFNLKIYSREGNLIYEGGNEEGLWDAIPNRGILQQNKVVPVGTYFYVLVLNDPNYPDPFIGDVYVNY
ncbi:MAG: gliding motility-associated C-terminal domain-containing protein [Flavobacteriaceae bacterium]|nr:gliding motility-associated C-terminal domain-containing protein [Flavobacteriaceae bacterium]